MADEWVFVSYASVIVKGFSLREVPAVAGPVFFDKKTVFNGFAAPFETSGGLKDVALDGMIESGPWERHKDHSIQVSGENDDSVTFVSLFDARLATLNIEGVEGMAIGPHNCVDDLNILFAPGVNAVGFDLFRMDGSLEGITVSLFDMAEQLIATTGVASSEKSRFFGVIDEGNLIGRISLHANYKGRTESDCKLAPGVDAEASAANDNPKPTTLVLFGLGLASLGVARRSRSAVAHLKGR